MAAVDQRNPKQRAGLSGISILPGFNFCNDSAGKGLVVE
jgi:hypothetical protein